MIGTRHPERLLAAIEEALVGAGRAEAIHGPRDGRSGA